MRRTLRPAVGRVAVAVVAVVLAIATGCGGDGSSPPYFETVEHGLEADGHGLLTLTTDEAECAAAKIAGSIPEYRLKELGIETVDLRSLDLSVSERTIVYEAFDACLNLHEQLAGALAAAGSLTDAQSACLADRALASPQLRDVAVVKTPGPALQEQLDSVAAGCSSS